MWSKLFEKTSRNQKENARLINKSRVLKGNFKSKGWGSKESGRRADCDITSQPTPVTHFSGNQCDQHCSSDKCPSECCTLQPNTVQYSTIRRKCPLCICLAEFKSHGCRHKFQCHDVTELSDLSALSAEHDMTVTKVVMCDVRSRCCSRPVYPGDEVCNPKGCCPIKYPVFWPVLFPPAEPERSEHHLSCPHHTQTISS